MNVKLSFTALLTASLFLISCSSGNNSLDPYIQSTVPTIQSGLIIPADMKGDQVQLVMPANESIRYAVSGSTGEASVNTSVDNSHFLPPIGNQGTQNSCVGWAWGYYYKSYQENKEHNRTDINDRSKPENICSPSFIYNLIQIKSDGGSSPEDAFKVLNDFGCAALDKMPYNENDYKSWPSEAAFDDAIKRRTSVAGTAEFYEISTTTDSGLNQIKQMLLNG